MTLSNSICAVLVAVIIIVMALNSYEMDIVSDMVIKGCDPFGYAHMADAMRDGRASGTVPDFFMHDDQTLWLIAKFKQSGLPVESWDEVVTVPSFHYFPDTDRVGPQYPPGTGWVMSFFPKLNAVRIIDKFSILLLSIGGLLLMAWCIWKGLPMSGLITAAATVAFLSPYQWMGERSFSINVTIFPLFLGSLLAWLAVNISNGNRIAPPILAFGSGLLFGLIVQTRIASFLLLPALALIFLPGRIRLLFWYLAGVVLNGVIPVMLHNKLIAGSFFAPTYNHNDQRQGLEFFDKDLRFYSDWIAQFGAYYALGLLLVTLLFLAAIAVTSRGVNAGWKLWLKNHYGLALAPLATLFISVTYFLTHFVVIPYYPLPCMLQASLLSAFLFVAIEMHWKKTVGNFVSAKAIRGTAVGITVLAAIFVVALDPSWPVKIVSGISKAKEPPPFVLKAPPEILRPDSWIWCDVYPSTIVYYGGHPSFKIPFGKSSVRKLMYGWVKDKGDSQYMVIETDAMKNVMAEAQTFGWRFTPVGDVFDAPCYKMEMP